MEPGWSDLTSAFFSLTTAESGCGGAALLSGSSSTGPSWVISLFQPWAKTTPTGTQSPIRSGRLKPVERFCPQDRVEGVWWWWWWGVRHWPLPNFTAYMILPLGKVTCISLSEWCECLLYGRCCAPHWGDKQSLNSLLLSSGRRPCELCGVAGSPVGLERVCGGGIEPSVGGLPGGGVGQAEI